MSDLFRKEVIDKQSSKHLGDVIVATPLSFWAITLLIAAIIAGLIAFAVFGEYARKERVQGVLTPSAGLINIVSPRHGHFESVNFDVGDAVQAGDVLFTLSEETIVGNGDDLNEKLMGQMLEEQTDIKRQLSSVSKKFQLRESRLTIRLREKQEEISRIEQQVDVQKRAVELEESILSKMVALFKEEAASALEVSSQENKYLVALQSLNRLNNSIENIDAEIKDTRAEKLLLPGEQKEEETTLRNRISNIEQQILRNSANSEWIIHAPVSGIVATVNARVGQTSDANQTLMTILPRGSKLQAELYVPTRAIGFVKKGQSVKISYHAFPYQKFGFFNGKLIEVSKSVITDQMTAQPTRFSEPVFLVRVSLDKQSINASGESILLQSGMSISADLILEDRKIWEWAFDPLLGAIR